MEKREMLYEGKAKKVFKTDDPELLIVDYKDDATAFNGEKKGTIMGKGVVNNRMTNHVFAQLEKVGVPTHLVKELSDRETLVKKVSIVPLEVIVRNVAAGSFSKRMGVPEGTKLLCPIFTWGKFERSGDKTVMPLTIQIHHASADGFHIAQLFQELQWEVDHFSEEQAGA